MKLECDVENGIVFNEGTTLGIQIGYKDFRRKVKSIRKIGETLSGKSVKLKMSVEYEQWDNDNGEWETVIFDKGETLVRLNYYNDFIYQLEKLEDGYKVVNI